MPRNSGTIAIMQDGRKVIIFNNQPLAKEKSKVVVHLIDDSFNLIIENDKPKILLFDVSTYNEIVKTWKGIGKVD